MARIFTGTGIKKKKKNYYLCLTHKHHVLLRKSKQTISCFKLGIESLYTSMLKSVLEHFNSLLVASDITDFDGVKVKIF